MSKVKRPSISVVMPVRNEEAYIANCIESLFNQTYPIDDMEWIFVDGMSNDHTRNIISSYVRRFPRLIHLLDNPSKTVPYAMNIGIAEAKGEYIIRLDAHASYANDYIEKCIYYLENTDADNVGGVAETKSHGFIGNAIAKMLSSKFGVGNSQFRTEGESGYVDTVPFGAFRREVFEKWGGYDERLVRNQDNEMNYRIRSNGGKIYMSKDIRLTYYCRDTASGIARMAIQNGMWNVITMKLCPGSMSVRHFVPLAFVLSILALTLLGVVATVFWELLAVELVLYCLLDAAFACKASRSLREIVLIAMLFPVFHISYGLGSLLGLGKLCTGNCRS
ncbi:glycosyltransferase family 2 protein [Adlercreutzia sp. ZJ141]|uniref:glycosyltransferase family 2 protein n=1 Tax=Adlercreutzia sp. ZJ141 TaxID=2709406 RepID=UPI0013EC6BDA|nr:glycosyltransferase family 2 protein [Adlercreutzia sp. ZJ141]